MLKYSWFFTSFFPRKWSWLLGVWLFFFLLWLFIPALTGGYIQWSIYDSDDQLRKEDYRFYWSNGTVTDKYVLTIPLRLTTNRIFQIYPNDCIRNVIINHKPFTGLQGDLCNAWKGVTIDAKDLLILGDNIIQVEVQEKQYKRSFYIKPSVSDSVRMWSFIGIGIGWFCILVFWFSRYFVRENKKHGRIILGMFALMFALALGYMINSELFKWSADITGHLDYIKLLLRGERIPISDACRQCYHPNPYYRFSKFVYRFGEIIWRMEPFELIRVVTWMGWWIGIGFASRFLYLLLYNKKTRITQNSRIFFIALALFYFWPLQFYFSVKISNDIFHYVCTYIALYFALNAWMNSGGKDDKKLWHFTLLAFGWNMIGIFMKSNSIIRFPIMLVPLLVRFFKGSFFPNLITFKKLLLRLLLLWIIGIAGILGLSALKGVHGIVDNADRLQSGTELDNIPLSEAFFTFYPSEFIKEKFLRVNDTNRSYKSFWNIFLKSMIIGENIETKNKHTYFYLMTIPGLLLILCMFLNLINLRRKELFMWVGILIPFTAMMIYRGIYPLAPSMHFRYVHPVLIFVIYFIIYWFIDLKQKQDIRLKHIVLLLAIVVFISYGIYFSLPPYF